MKWWFTMISSILFDGQRGPLEINFNAVPDYRFAGVDPTYGKVV